MMDATISVHVIEIIRILMRLRSCISW